MRKLLTVTGLTAVTVVVLTGCSPTPSLFADDCTRLDEQLPSLNAQVEMSMASVSVGDFGAAAVAFDDLRSTLAYSAQVLTDAEVKSALTDLTDSVAIFGSLIREVESAGEDVDALLSVQEKLAMQASLMHDAGTALSELCSEDRA